MAAVAGQLFRPSPGTAIQGLNKKLSLSMNISSLFRIRKRISRRLAQHAADRRVSACITPIHGPAMTRLNDDQVALVIVGRDVSYFLDHHIRHHLKLGVSHIVYVDNGSTDDSISIARRFDNVTIARCTADFRNHQNQIRYFANTKFLKGGWRLAIDPDELLDYPGSDRIDLPELTRRMTARGHTALVAQMLDMVYDGPIADTDSMDFAKAERHFDRFSLMNITDKPYDSEFLKDLLDHNRATNPDIRFLFGGLRRTAFGEQCCLTKHALFKMERGVVPHPHPHATSGVTCTDFSALLRHYKFAGNVLARERKLLAENRIRHGETRLRVERFEADDDLNLGDYAEHRAPTIPFLIKHGFLQASEAALKMVT